MTTLDKINPEKPLSLYGAKTIKSDEPVFIDLAARFGNERFRSVSTPVTEPIKIAGGEAKRFLELVKLHSRNLFEENLQCLAETKRGEPLLTGWMTLEHYKGFVDQLCASPFAPSALCLQLAEPFTQWRELGVEEVYFDGYQLARESAPRHEHC